MEKFISYWRIVYYRIIRKMAKMLKEHIINGIILLLAYIFGACLTTYGLIQIEWVNNIIEDIISWETFGLGMSILIIFFLITSVFIQPPQIHWENIEEIKKISSELESIKKQISRKNIQPIPPSKIYVNNNQRELHLEIKNDSGKELRNYFTIVLQMGFSEDADAEIKTINIPKNLKLRWPGDGIFVNRDMDKAIAPNDIASISIVKTQTNFFKLDTIHSIQNKFNDQGFYYIDFVVGGVIDEIGVKNCVHVKIKYEGGTDINIVEFLDFNCENKTWIQ